MATCEITGLGLHIKVADMEASRRFYESLGFKPVFGYGSEDFRATLPEGVASAAEAYRGIVYQIGENGPKLEIADGHIAVADQQVFSAPVVSPKVSAMINVASIAPLFTNPEVSITFPVRHYYWGTIEAAFRDPDGFVVVFIAPFSEDELARVKDYVEVEEVKPNV